MMKNVLRLLVCVTIPLVISEHRAAAEEAPPAEVGRYQAVTSFDGRIFVLDTATGQCWSRSSRGTWHDEGNPTRMNPGRQANKTPEPPLLLKLPSDSVEMTIIQREERAVPGSDGTVMLRLGDITEGQVLLTVIAADGTVLHKRTSVKQGDQIQFVVGKKQYVLKITEMRNFLLGDDFAKIRIQEADKGNSKDKLRSEKQEP
ncbi:hypothetical protein Pan241w_41970 [Gimesia alba]|uniref:Uncharacterized protein n=1 Tax=Gimesia alba TaxID=2527973 RepID=A0A517RJN9_9PLAN|nr:hypothetical protein [Gimesia alba]QDT44091.1 hypothetical protein Pan241w_41970 [Gimesia alba]